MGLVEGCDGVEGDGRWLRVILLCKMCARTPGTLLCKTDARNVWGWCPREPTRF